MRSRGVRPRGFLLACRHCEEQRDEAIQKQDQQLDCFASLAMTRFAGASNLGYDRASGPSALFQEAMPPSIWQAEVRPASCAACTAIAERSP
jgi:hypothetical protein